MGKIDGTIKLVLIIFIILAMIYGNLSFIQNSYSSGDYAPPSSVIDDVINPDRKPVIISGNVYFEQNNTVANNIYIRLFSMDELKEEFVTTNSYGEFVSINKYATGQLIKIRIGIKVFVENIPYNAEGIYWLGIFYY